ncbi:hypothetical protein T10_2684 [Trichinella papuae]|uniref:Uncharacterized protein n=1 Tax=Trichinella papuae TaxID=268474 RepID=A0A0V1LZ12_9BILA|nr:hypothetical protein T10_2684 [Trichinella papuae]
MRKYKGIATNLVSRCMKAGNNCERNRTYNLNNQA